MSAALCNTFFKLFKCRQSLSGFTYSIQTPFCFSSSKVRLVGNDMFWDCKAINEDGVWSIVNKLYVFNPFSPSHTSNCFISIISPSVTNRMEATEQCYQVERTVQFLLIFYKMHEFRELVSFFILWIFR